jgi:ubiquinone/menaquinone biosynthesis C-methylase UbiE
MKSDEIKIHRTLAGRYRELAKKRYYLIYQEYWNSRILESASRSAESSVLECGSGSGLLLEFLSRIYRHVYGLDLSLDMLDIAAPTEKNYTPLLCCAQEIGLKNESFDLVICKSSLHHTPEPGRAIREIHRILKKDGTLIISEPCRDNFLWRKIGRGYTRLSKGFSGHHHLFRTRQIKELLAQNGFEIQRSRYFGLVGFPLCGAAHQFPVMNILPFNQILARWLVKIDEKLITIPGFKSLRWHIIIHSKKL